VPVSGAWFERAISTPFGPIAWIWKTYWVPGWMGTDAVVVFPADCTGWVGGWPLIPWRTL
jgi:hypothetical protein